MTIQSIVPIVRVTDIRVAETFYCSVLGFRKEWERSGSADGPFYVGLTRAGGALQLSSFTGDGAVGAAVYLNVSNVDRLYADLQRAGLEDVELEPTNQPWGRRELYVRDPDGNSLRFGAGIVPAADEPKYTLALVRVFVSDFARALGFYMGVLGMQSSRIDEANGFAQLSTGEAELAIERLNPADSESTKLIGRFLGVSLAVANIHASYFRLVSKGVEFVEPPEKQPWGGTLAHFEDPDANVLTLVEYPAPVDPESADE